jgi:hypothetical protein
VIALKNLDIFKVVWRLRGKAPFYARLNVFSPESYKRSTDRPKGTLEDFFEAKLLGGIRFESKVRRSNVSFFSVQNLCRQVLSASPKVQVAYLRLRVPVSNIESCTSTTSTLTSFFASAVFTALSPLAKLIRFHWKEFRKQGQYKCTKPGLGHYFQIMHGMKRSSPFYQEI